MFFGVQVKASAEPFRDIQRHIPSHSSVVLAVCLRLLSCWIVIHHHRMTSIRKSPGVSVLRPLHYDGACCAPGKWFCTLTQTYASTPIDRRGPQTAPWTLWIRFWSEKPCELRDPLKSSSIIWICHRRTTIKLMLTVDSFTTHYTVGPLIVYCRVSRKLRFWHFMSYPHFASSTGVVSHRYNFSVKRSRGLLQ